MKSEDYFLVSLALIVSMLIAAFFIAEPDPYLSAACFYAFILSAFLSIGFFISGIVKKIVEMQKSQSGQEVERIQQDETDIN